jgi:hypothetical protein
MQNEFDNIPDHGTLGPVTISDATKSALAQDVADALRRGYTEADLRMQFGKVLEIVLPMAKAILGLT